MINGYEINGAEINGSGDAPEITLPITYIFADGVELTAPIVISAAEAFNLSAPIEITAHQFNTVGQSINWSVSALINAVDYSARLTGGIRIERQLNASALAELSLVPLSGPVNPTAFEGQSISIRYTDERGTSPLFSGTVIRSVIDMNDGVLSLTCSDLLQERTDALSRAQIDGLIDHARSNSVYRDPNSNWEYAQQCLKSAEGDFFKDVHGGFRFVPWSVSPDVTHDDASIFHATLAPRFEDRHTLINRIDIDLQWRFLFGWHRVHKLQWGIGMPYARWLWESFSTTPSREMIERAIPADMVLAKADYQDLPPTGLYYYRLYPVVFNNLSPGYFAYSFDIDAVERWLQTVTHKLSLSVLAQVSIERYGEISKNETYSLDSNESDIDWHQLIDSNDMPRGKEFGIQMGKTDSGPRTGSRSAPPEGDFVEVSLGFNNTYRVNLYSDNNTPGMSQSILLCAVREARKNIIASHQNVSVNYEVPINPLLQLAVGIDIDATKVQTQGRVTRLEHRLDFDSGLVFTALTLTPYANSEVFDVLPLEWDEIPIEDSPLVNVGPVPLSSHFGKTAVEPPEPDPEWRGYVGNYSTFNNYPESFTVEIPEVNESLRDNLEVEQVAVYSIDVQLDKITLTL